MSKNRFLATTGAVLAVAYLTISAAHAQVAPGESQAAPDDVLDRDDGASDIIVTARKRDESIMRTPVVMQAISSEQIQNLKIVSMQDLASVTPGLAIGSTFVSVGASVFMRGLGNGESAQFIDQSVLLNLDGVAMSHGVFYRLGTFDAGQIEVLKGPQALFFGKSSSAGIIAISSADPTSQFESKISGGYEFNGDEVLLEGQVSGPLTDSVGIRVAGYFNDRKGWLTNPSTFTVERRVPEGYEYGGRVTFKFDDGGRLRARLKAGALRARDNAPASGLSQNVCVGAAAQKNGPFGYFDDCRINRFVSGVGDAYPYNPTLDYNGGGPNVFLTGTFSPLFRNGRPYTEIKAEQASLNVDYDLTSGLTLTSVTGLSKVRAQQGGSQPFIANGGRGDVLLIAGNYRQRDFTQELRLTSAWDDSPINFMIGGLINRTTAKNEVVLIIPSFAFGTDDDATFETRNKSAFAQLLVTPNDQFELSLGGRYTDVTRYFSSMLYSVNGNPFSEQIGLIPESVKRIQEDNFSPEVTLTFRPIPDITTFVSYKRGYKGPGFNNDLTAVSYGPNAIESFAGEKVRGFEGGVKAVLLDRQLNLTAAAYSFHYLGQQVSFVNSTDSRVITSNGANARVKGVELGAGFRPRAIEGLTLSGFVNYNHADYTSFPAAPCYGNQTPEMGCVGGVQNLAGKQLHRAPRWVAQIGGEYRTALSGALAAAISVNTNISSSYNVVAELNPYGVQKSYATFDASLRVGKLDGPWEVALIGRNLSNKYVFSSGQDGGFAIPNVVADATVYTYRPRQIMVQLTVRPGQ